MNLFLSRLDEQQRRWYVALEAKQIGQRRWYVALEAKQIGHGGPKQMSRITGMHVETIRRGLRELEDDLAGRPVDRVRLPGGGRHRIEKRAEHHRRSRDSG